MFKIHTIRGDEEDTKVKSSVQILLEICDNALKQNSAIFLCLFIIIQGQGLAAMATLQNLLEIQECELVVDNLTNLVLNDSDCSVRLLLQNNVWFLQICVIEIRCSYEPNYLNVILILCRNNSLTRIASISQKDNYDQIVLRCTVTKLVNALHEGSVKLWTLFQKQAILMFNHLFDTYATFYLEPMDVDSEANTVSSKHVFLNGLEVLSTTLALVKTNVEHLITYLDSFASGKLYVVTTSIQIFLENPLSLLIFHFTARYSSCGKVMFSQVCVCLQGYAFSDNRQVSVVGRMGMSVCEYPIGEGVSISWGGGEMRDEYTLDMGPGMPTHLPVTDT